MKLLIVESPAKVKTISKYLGAEYKVTSSVGHIRDLPKSNKDAVNIAGGFEPRYVVVPAKEKVVNELRSLTKKADEVYLATDPDREGEAIAWHIADVCDLEKSHKAKRIVFHEITEGAVKEALLHPRTIDQNLRKAQEARRVLDRLFGYDLSGLIWKKVRYGLSAGRVQSPALRILMEREREIRAFIPEKFWVITAETKTKNGDKLILTCDEEPRNESLAKKIIAVGKAGAWAVASMKESETKRAPRPPFTTSTLQQSASTRLGFSPSRTMQIAQKLYEQGHITYMRTDSTNLSSIALAEIAGVVAKKYGANHLETRVFKTKSKSAQEAHEAIRPAHAKVLGAGTTPEQKKLYELIWQRAVASQMADAVLLKTKITAHVKDEDIPTFSANGSRMLFPGWLKADPVAGGVDTELPKVASGEPLKLLSIDSLEKQTEPPNRYSEAGLVKELEKRGIGRPSTYASTIQTLITRLYVTRENKTLYPTDLGEVVSDFVEKYFGGYISDTFTSHMEDELDEIAEGVRGYETTLKEFYMPFAKEVKLKEKLGKQTDIGEVPAEFICPVCGGGMVWKLSRGGKFMSCARFPDCQGARTIEGKELEPPKETGEICPKCGKGKLIEREGRFGKFIGCANYPKCKFIKQDEEELKKKETGVACPECKTGIITERRGRFGLFYSCNNYPSCRFAMKARPTGASCRLCGSLMMEGTKTIPERCSSKACVNYQPGRKQKKKEE